MSRGVVLWPDDAVSARISGLWESLSERGIPTLATETHCSHRPHLSLVVAHWLSEHEALGAVAPVPSRPLPLLVSSCGVFPGGVLFLACVPSAELLAEQRRVYEAVEPLCKGPWSDSYAPGVWTPHVTVSWRLDDEQLARAVPLVVEQLPITGSFTRGGIEDGDTGERWESPSPSAPPSA